jgi:hypothetical protein
MVTVMVVVVLMVTVMVMVVIMVVVMVRVTVMVTVMGIVHTSRRCEMLGERVLWRRRTSGGKNITHPTQTVPDKCVVR